MNQVAPEMERSGAARRPMTMPLDRRIARRALALAVFALLTLGACSGSTAGASPGSSQAAASAAPASPGPVTTADEAVERILAVEPRLRGIAPQDPDSVGASSWYTVTPTDDGFEVQVYVGWGDCMAGCISHHAWTYAVAGDGTVALVKEEGEPVPDAEWPSPGGTGRSGIFGTALAGPICPVEQPDDPNCAPRTVGGATVRVADAAGTEVASVVTDQAGRFFVELPPGAYTLSAEPVDGLMGTPAALVADVGAGESVVTLSYDTGIR
jgi:hypothetical protein